MPDANRKFNKYGVEETKMHLQAGWFGRVFGSGDTARTNIMGVTIIACFVAIIVVMLCFGKDGKDFLSAIIAVITLCLGYLAGKQSSQ